MERKLDDIVNLLATRANGVPVDAAEDPDSGFQQQNSTPTPLPHVFGRPKRCGNGENSHTYEWRTTADTHDSNDKSGDDAMLIDRPLPSVKLTFAEMHTAVDAWRPQLAENFPFAALYEGQSTTWMLVERPFLSTAIAVAALYGDLERQMELSKCLMKDIGESMLMKGEKNLDLLEGILVLLAWLVPVLRLRVRCTGMLC